MVTFFVDSDCRIFGERSKMLYVFHPQSASCVRGHFPRSARAERNRADLWAVRAARTLELLAEEPFDKQFHPVPDFFVVEFTVKCFARHKDYFFRRKAIHQHVVYEEIMQFIGSYDIFGYLCDFSTFACEFRAYRCGNDVFQYGGNSAS